MTKTVWKYTVPPEPGPHTIEMGRGKKILHVGSSDGVLMHFWAEHDGPVEDRTFQIFGTGDVSIPEAAEHVGTVVYSGHYALVLHLYDVTKVGTK